jgi:hypothetical protein
MVRPLGAQGIKIAADVSTEPQQTDFAGVVQKVKASDTGACSCT